LGLLVLSNFPGISAAGILQQQNATLARDSAPFRPPAN
jgi:hypothetical protein